MTLTVSAWVLLASGLLVLGVAATTVLTKGRAPKWVDPAARMLLTLPVLLAWGGGAVVGSVTTVMHAPSEVQAVASIIGALSMIVGAVLILRARLTNSSSSKG